MADSQLQAWQPEVYSNVSDLYQNYIPGIYENCFFTVWDIAPFQIAGGLFSRNKLND